MPEDADNTAHGASLSGWCRSTFVFITNAAGGDYKSELTLSLITFVFGQAKGLSAARLTRSFDLSQVDRIAHFHHPLFR